MEPPQHNHGKVHAEVIDTEDSAWREVENADAEHLGEGDAAEDVGAHVDHRSPDAVRRGSDGHFVFHSDVDTEFD